MEKINLGKRKVNKIRMFFNLIFYYAYRTETSKSVEEFKHGLIRHECEYDFTSYRYYEGEKSSHKCKHYGCNFVTPKEKDGSYIDPWLNKISKDNKTYRESKIRSSKSTEL